MAHIQEVPSLLSLAYVQHGMGIDEGATWVKEKVERSWEKTDSRARKDVRDEYEAAMTTLESRTDER